MNEKTASFLLEKVRRDYNSIAEDFSATRMREWTEFELFAPYIRNGMKVLDVGCGNGRLLSFFQKRFSNIFYTGIDNASRLLDEARLKRIHALRLFSDEKNGKEFDTHNVCLKHANHENSKAEFFEGNMLSLPFPSETFDAVFSIASLHHIPSEKFRTQALMEMKRVLKPHGVIIILVWNLWQKRYFYAFIRAFFRSIFTFGQYGLRDLFIPWKHVLDRYYYAFTFSELQKFLKKTSLSLESYSRNRNILFVCKKK
ncbi:class I SAM-dependent methyltransferase [Candidatus Peregrinibacteria bacterium]|nr:class I SAM-dependent methyltransferase [Candidatus Peregrinibacteria bacterium]